MDGKRMGQLNEKKQHHKAGFTLLEVLIALAVFSVGMLGLLGMVATSIQANTLSQQTSVATNLAQDKLEEMKNMSFDSLFQPSAADPTLSTNAPPADMTDIDPVTGTSTTVSAGDNGGNTCSANSPCGDVTANDLIWTYSRPATIDNKSYNRIWTVQRNPTLTVNGANQTVFRSIRLEAIASWTDSSGRAHRVSVATIVSG
jgi:prepilin-type N-terminal cleavage/methylation domain-containing protein